MLWPQVIAWLDVARDCFGDQYGSLQRGFLTSVFGLVVGLQRVFHLDQMQDLGFALLTGDSWRCPSRHEVGAWRRHVPWNEVDRFCHRTSPWEQLHGQDLLMSFDEHAIPRWTKKFSIPKGYVTTRNKYMRCEKLYLGYELRQRRFTTIKGTPGNVELRDVVDEFRLRQHHEQGYRVQVHDEFINATPCGYDKESPDRQRPRFCRGPLQMMGWLAALVYNACADLAEGFSPSYAGKFISTLRRTFFNKPGSVYRTPNTLIVYLDAFDEQDAVVDYIDHFNASEHRIPWCGNRKLVLSLSPRDTRGPCHLILNPPSVENHLVLA